MNRLINLKLITSLTLFISISVSAGITSLGNGGGLAELQFIYFLKNTDQIVNICYSNPKCLAEVQPSLDFKKLISANASVKNNIQIHFRSDINENWIWNNSLLIINQQWLYPKGSVMRSDSEIISLALAIQFNHFGGINFDEALLKLLKGYKNLIFQKKTAQNLQNNFFFHDIEITSSLNKIKLLVIEDQKNSYLLNDLFINKIPTLDIHQIEIYNTILTTQGSTLTIFGTVSGQTLKNHFEQAPFKITIQLSSEQLLNENSFELFLFVE